MAPQQNSTFIDDDSRLRMKLAKNQSTKRDDNNDNDDDDDDRNDNDEEEIIKRCSPILALIDDDRDGDDDHDHDDEDNDGGDRFCELPKKCSIENSTKKNRQYNYKQFRKGNGNGNGNGNGKGNNTKHPAQGCRSQRSRSISLHGANSTIDQGQTEITIWIDDEPRYVSGVTRKTTCSDIVKALIDDEMENGNKAFFQRFERDGGGNGADVKKTNVFGSTDVGVDGDGVCATSRDYSDYVITESWRGIERGYDGNITILPVWKTWSRVHNEFRLRLRHRRDIQDPIQFPMPTECQQICQNQRQSLLQRCLSSLRRLWRKQKPSMSCRSTSKMIESKENCLRSKNGRIPDELLFVIMPDKKYETKTGKDNGSGNRNVNGNGNGNQSDRISTDHRTQQRRRSSRKGKARRKKLEHRINGVSSQSCIRRRQPITALSALNTSSIQNTVRFRLAQKTSEMDALYAREYALTRELSEKCKLYRLQNQIYSNPDQQWNLSIGQVQRKIENYAREIVRTEHELLELKNEIRQDISLINNLKRMSLARDGDETRILCPTLMPSATATATATATLLTPQPNGPASHQGLSQEMQFVDNIYEFCDNNASMLV